jgi:hypothetical protein
MKTQENRFGRRRHSFRIRRLRMKPKNRKSVRPRRPAAAQTKRGIVPVPQLGRSEGATDLKRYLEEVASLFSEVFAGFDLPNARSGGSKKSSQSSNLTEASHLGYLARVLARWAEDPRFVTEQGRPSDLPEKGGLSFAFLVAEEIPGEDASRCLEALLATGSVVRLKNGLLRWRRRAAISRCATNMLEVLRPLRALLMNLQPIAVLGSAPTTSFMRGVSGFEVTERDVVDLCALLEHHGMMLLELVDNFLSQRARANARLRSKRTRFVRPYVGIVMSSDADMPTGIARLKRHPG